MASVTQLAGGHSGRYVNSRLRVKKTLPLTETTNFITVMLWKGIRGLRESR